MKNAKLIRAGVALLLSMVAIAITGCQKKESWRDELDEDALAELILRNAEYYSRHCMFPDIYIALADITGDGKPEIFLGAPGTVLVSNIRYTAYTRELRVLPIGEKTRISPDGIGFESNSSDYKFLYSAVFNERGNEKRIHLAKAWNGRYGENTNELYWFTKFYCENGEWKTEKYFGKWYTELNCGEDLTAEILPYEYEIIPVSQTFLFTAWPDESISKEEVLGLVEKAIEEYENEEKAYQAGKYDMELHFQLIPRS